MWQEQGKDFSFSLLGCCQAGMAEVEWLVVVDDDKAGCWLVCAHTDSLHIEDSQAACADPGVGPGAAVKVSDPSVWGYRALLMWKCDDFSLCGLCIDQCPGNLGQQVVK